MNRIVYVSPHARTRPPLFVRLLPPLAALFLVLVLGVLRSYEYRTIVCLTAAVLVYGICYLNLVGGPDCFDFRLNTPKRLYGFFFALYYCTSLVVFATNDSEPQHNAATIAAIISIGFAGWYIGMMMGTRASQASTRTIAVFDPGKSQTLVWLCVFGAICVVVHFIWRLSIGQFYTHGQAYVQDTTLKAAVLENFCGAFEFPVVLLSGLLTGVPHPKVAKRARLITNVYSVALFLTQILASEFRPALTTVVFWAASRQTAGTFRLRWRHIAMGGVALTLALVVVQGTRAVQASSMSFSENQFNDSAVSVNRGLEAAFGSESRSVREATTSRASGPISFLSQIVDATERGHSYLYGTVVLESLYGLVPRLVWPSKPVLTSSQLMIEQKLGLPLIDASPGPAIAFFADGGLIGVFFLYACFGIFLSFLTRFAKGNHVGASMALLWTWSSVAIVETDMIMGILVMLRHALCTYLIFRLLHLCRGAVPIFQAKSEVY